MNMSKYFKSLVVGALIAGASVSTARANFGDKLINGIRLASRHKIGIAGSVLATSGVVIFRNLECHGAFTASCERLVAFGYAGLLLVTACMWNRTVFAICDEFEPKMAW